MKKILTGDPETRSADLLAENVDCLKTIFPEAFSEGQVDFDVLRQLLGGTVNDDKEKYGLSWLGKGHARHIALTQSAGTLRPCPEDSVDWDSTQNMMIKGDNLEVLKLLQKSYANKVKLIYIDPPYNTGKDFIYSDDYRDTIRDYLMATRQIDDHGHRLASNPDISGRFHTAWLNMMYPRMKLARTLLKHDGAIFISIDDNELHDLRIVMDDIFGGENFVATVIWQKVFSPKNTAAYFSSDHDYLIVYARSKESWKPSLLQRTEKNLSRYKNPDSDPRGVWMSGAIQARNYYSKGQYQVTSPSGKTFSNPKGTYWRVSLDRFKELDQDDRIWWGENGDGVPRIKRFLSDVRRGVVPQTLWKHEDVGHTQEAKEELLRYVTFEHTENVLNSVKPSRLIRQILKIATSVSENDLVLDFFAGSGTTGHAVLAQNNDDGGSRRFIAIQLPEPLVVPESEAKTIFDLAKSRLRAVGTALANRDVSPIETDTSDSDSATRSGEDLDLGFRVFKLDTSNIRAWNPTPSNLEGALLSGLDHILPDRTAQDILYELLLKLGLDLCVSINTKTITGKIVHSVGAGTLFACLDESIAREEVEPLAAAIADWHDTLAPAADSTVVFRDSAFTDDVAKTNLVETLKQRGLGNVRSL